MSLLYKYTHHWEIWLISSDFYAFALRHVWQAVEKLLAYFCFDQLIKVYFSIYSQINIYIINMCNKDQEILTS